MIETQYVEKVWAIITHRNVATWALPAMIQYRGSVYGPHGAIHNVPITRPENRELSPDVAVMPLAIGTRIKGERVAASPMAPGEYRWDYAERPRTRVCGS